MCAFTADVKTGRSPSNNSRGSIAPVAASCFTQSSAKLTVGGVRLRSSAR